MHPNLIRSGIVLLPLLLSGCFDTGPPAGAFEITVKVPGEGTLDLAMHPPDGDPTFDETRTWERPRTFVFEGDFDQNGTHTMLLDVEADLSSGAGTHLLNLTRSQTLSGGTCQRTETVPILIDVMEKTVDVQDCRRSA